MVNVALKPATAARRTWSRRAQLTGIVGTIAAALGPIFRVLARIYGDQYLAAMTTMLVYVTGASMLSPKNNRIGYR